MPLSIEETLNYRHRTIYIDTSIDPDARSITSHLSTDAGVVDVRNVSASTQLDGVNDAERLGVIQDLLEDAHRYVRTRLLSGRYDAAIDAGDSEAGGAVNGASDEPSKDLFSAVDVGPEAFADPAHRRELFEHIGDEIDAETRRRQPRTGPLFPKSSSAEVAPSAQAAATQVAPPDPVVPEVGDKAAFPQLSVEVSEVELSEDEPGKTAEFSAETDVFSPERSVAQGAATAFFAWAKDHSMKAVCWSYGPSSVWTPTRRPGDSLRELEETTPWAAFLADWERFVHHIEAAKGPATTAWVSDDKCVVIVFDGDEAVTALVPARLLGVTLSAADRLIERETSAEVPLRSAEEPQLPAPRTPKKRPDLGAS